MISQKPYTERLMRFHLAKQGNTFIPASDSDKQKMDKIGQGEVVVASSVDQRNYKLLQKYWVLMNLAFDNLPEQFDGYWLDVNDFEEEVLKSIGWKTVSKNFKGEHTIRAKSISFEKCTEEQFQKIFDRALTLICRLIGVEEEDIMDQLLTFM